MSSKHFQSSEALCGYLKCAHCLLEQFKINSKKFTGVKLVPCHLKTDDGRFIPCFDIGTIQDGKTVLEIGKKMFAVPCMIKSLKIMYNQSIAEAQQRNMQIYAKILFSHGLERTDLVYVGQRYNLEDFGKGLFARTDIPGKTVLGVYPGEIISMEELEERKESREEGEKFVLIHNGKIIDGTGRRDTNMIFANDEPHQKATCFAKSLHINGEFHPFIITKTDILRGQELTWDYGNGKEYPWRSQPSEISSTDASKSQAEPVTVKKRYNTGMNRKYKPLLGNKEGDRLPLFADRAALSNIILRDIILPIDKARSNRRKHRAPKACSSKARLSCPECKLQFTSLTRHNCKGIAPDGGVVARRSVRFCPVCIDHRGVFTDLPRHIRNVHGFDPECTRKITSSYSSVNRRYSHGTLQKTNVWHQAVQANQPGADSSSVSRMEPPESDSSSNEIIMSSDED